MPDKGDCVAVRNRSHIWVIGQTTCVVCGAAYENPYLDAWLAELNDGGEDA